MFYSNFKYIIKKLPTYFSFDRSSTITPNGYRKSLHVLHLSLSNHRSKKHEKAHGFTFFEGPIPMQPLLQDIRLPNPSE